MEEADPQYVEYLQEVEKQARVVMAMFLHMQSPDREFVREWDKLRKLLSERGKNGEF